jgi:hypothetical protein
MTDILPMNRRSLVFGLIAAAAAAAAAAVAVPLLRGSAAVIDGADEDIVRTSWVPLPRRRCGWGWPIDDDGQTEDGNPRCGRP